MEESNNISSKINKVFCLCPLVKMGNKMQNADCANEHTKAKKLTAEEEKKVKLIKENIKMGKTIAIVGFCCPIFWTSLLTGQEPKVIILNLMHSSLFIAFGVFKFKSNQKKLKKYL